MTQGPPTVEPIVLEGDHVRLEPMTLEHLPALVEIGLELPIWTWMPVVVRTPDDLRGLVDAPTSPAVRDTDPLSARRTSSTTPAANISSVRLSMRRSSSSAGTTRPAISVGSRVSDAHRRSRAGTSDAPISASSSARTTRRRSRGCTAAAAAGSRASSCS